MITLDPGSGILASMPELIGAPSRVAAAGEPPKLIDEYVGRANTGQAGLSIAHMRSPPARSAAADQPATTPSPAHGLIGR